MGRASVVGARCWGTPVEFGCLLTYRQLISGCRAVRNLSPTGALFLFHDVRSYDPEWSLVRGPPRKGLGMCRRVTNKGESGFGKASDRVKAKHHRPSGILGVVGCPLSRREKARPLFEGHYRVPVSIPGALIKRRGPDPPLSPCRINTKSKHQSLNTVKKTSLQQAERVRQSQRQS